MAAAACDRAQRNAPKLTGASSAAFEPITGSNWYGIRWEHPYVWMQEQGIQPFTMNRIAGRVIPMWIDDQDGRVRAENPRAEVRTHQETGRTQVLIFRYAAPHGSRKIVRRRNRATGQMEERNVPRSYPGAPGRIVKREVYPRNIAGQIAPGNVGVRWRHPGLRANQFLLDGIVSVARDMNVMGPVYAGDPQGRIERLAAA
jgi:hypothetical protein